jgi:hypothetical protein
MFILRATKATAVVLTMLNALVWAYQGFVGVAIVWAVLSIAAQKILPEATPPATHRDIAQSGHALTRT